MSSSAKVINLFLSKAEVNGAWLDFQKLAAEAIEDPKRLTDREFFEAYLRAKARFEKLFTAMDRRG